jgi:hypothetical protein
VADIICRESEGVQGGVGVLRLRKVPRGLTAIAAGL